MHTTYEKLYINALKQCVIDQTLEFFGSMRTAFERQEQYEDYIRATIYWARLKLLISQYSDVETELSRIGYEPWFRDVNPFIQARLMLIKAKTYYSLGKFREAYEETDNALKKAPPMSDSEIKKKDEDFFFCRAYMVKAKINWRLRDVYRAKLYMALSWIYYSKGRKLEGHYLPARLLCHYGQIHLHEGEVEQAYRFFKESKKAYNRLGYKRHFYLPETLSLYASCKLEWKEFENAKKAIHTADRQLDVEFPGMMNRNRAHLRNLYARTCIGAAEHTTDEEEASNNLYEAIQYLFEEIRIRKSLFDNKEHFTLARIYNDLSKICRKLGAFKKAIEEAECALRMNVPKYNRNLSDESLIDLVSEASSTHHLLVSFQRMAEAYWHRYLATEKDAHKLEGLEEAWHYIRVCQEVINKIRERYHANESKIIVGTYARKIFELGMEILLERQEKAGRNAKAQQKVRNDIFRLFCNSKSFILLQSLHPYSISSISGKSDRSGNYSPSDLRQLMEDINTSFESSFNKEIINERLIKEVLTASEEDVKYIRKEPTEQRKLELKDIYKALSQEVENGDIISYFLGKRGVYVMVIQGKGGLQFKRLLRGEKAIGELKNDIKELAALFNNFEEKDIKGTFEEFEWALVKDITQNPNWKLIHYSTLFYRKLFRECSLSKEIKRLYIIPDEDLFHLPFGYFSRPLKGNETSYSSLPYLALDYKISYHISTALLFENHERNKKKDKRARMLLTDEDSLQLLSIAGKAMSKGKLLGQYNAPNIIAVRSIDKILQINSNVGRLSQMSGEELKSEFVKYAKELKIFHFFGHSHRQGDELCLLLESHVGDSDKNVLMTQAEIQNLDLRNSRLILINACKGGYGRTGNGEAPVSLFQAFLKAGAVNIYYSLFRINQRVAREFTVSFIQALKNRNSNFIDALSETQRAHIREGGVNSHPVIWASPSFIGNQMEKLHQ